MWVRTLIHTHTLLWLCLQEQYWVQYQYNLLKVIDWWFECPDFHVVIIQIQISSNWTNVCTNESEIYSILYSNVISPQAVVICDEPSHLIQAQNSFIFWRQVALLSLTWIQNKSQLRKITVQGSRKLKFIMKEESCSADKLLLFRPKSKVIYKDNVCAENVWWDFWVQA